MEAFLWGDGDRLSKGTELSDAQLADGARRLALTRIVRDTLDVPDDCNCETATDDLLTRYLVWSSLQAEARASIPSREAIEKEYLADKTRFEIPQTFSFRRLFFVAASDEQDAWQDAERRALEAYKALDGGAGFGLVRESADLPESQEKPLGPFAAGRIDPTLESAVLSLAEGEFSKPIRTKNGFHIVQLIESTAATHLTHDEAIALLEEQYARDSKTLHLIRALDSMTASNGENDPQLAGYYSSLLGRQVTPDEAARITGILYQKALSNNLDKTESHKLVSTMTTLRCEADSAFEAYVVGEYERITEDPERLKAFVKQHEKQLAESKRFTAESVIVQCDTNINTPYESYLDYLENRKVAFRIAEAWRNAPLDGPPGGVPVRVSEGVTIAEAGYQLSESVRELEVGEIGDPVYSKAKNTFMVSRLVDSTTPPLEGIPLENPTFANRLRNVLRKQLREDLQLKIEDNQKIQHPHTFASQN